MRQALNDAKRDGIYHADYVPPEDAIQIAKARVMNMLEEAVIDYFRKKFRAAFPVMDDDDDIP
mgnify:CR=1 FL=1